MSSVPLIGTNEGYVVVPVLGRSRRTTGVETARREATRMSIQLKLGLRSRAPGIWPVIRRAPYNLDLRLSFRHNNPGVRPGPVTGRLLAEMMTGATPIADPCPFRPERIG